jgi:chromosomal replication initiation ATPase DnaA
LADAWEQIKGVLAVKLGEGAYRNWIAATSLGSLENGELTVRVPNPTTETWIQQEYTGQILNAIQELRLPVHKVQYTIQAQAAAAAAGAAAAGGSTGPSHSSYSQSAPDV